MDHKSIKQKSKETKLIKKIYKDSTLNWVSYQTNGLESNDLESLRRKNKISVPSKKSEFKRQTLFTYSTKEKITFEIYFRLCYYNEWFVNEFDEKYHFFLEFHIKNRTRNLGKTDIKIRINKNDKQCASLLNIFKKIQKAATVLQLNNKVKVSEKDFLEKILTLF